MLLATTTDSSRRRPAQSHRPSCSLHNFCSRRLCLLLRVREDARWRVPFPARRVEPGTDSRTPNSRRQTDGAAAERRPAMRASRPAERATEVRRYSPAEVFTYPFFSQRPVIPVPLASLCNHYRAARTPVISAHYSSPPLSLFLSHSSRFRRRELCKIRSPFLTPPIVGLLTRR